MAFFAGGLAIMMALAELVKKGKTRNSYRLAGFYICLAVVIWNEIARQNGFFREWPGFFGWAIPAAYFMPPLFFMYLYDKIVKKYIPHWIEYVSLLPGVIITITIAVIHPHILNLLDMQVEFFRPGATIIRLLMIPAMAIGIMYMLYLVFEFTKTIKRKGFASFTLKTYIIFLIILAGICVAVISGIAISGQVEYVKFNTYLLSAGLLIWFVIEKRYPEYLEGARFFLKKNQADSKYLNGVDLPAVEKKLKLLFEEEKIYRNEQLTLAVLAKQLGLNTHQLSEYLNVFSRSSFPVFVNQYRIQEAKKLLQANKEDTILSIAFEVGFGSKSTFNSVFRNAVGMSPRSYREKKSLSL